MLRRARRRGGAGAVLVVHSASRCVRRALGACLRAHVAQRRSPLLRRRRAARRPVLLPRGRFGGRSRCRLQLHCSLRSPGAWCRGLAALAAWRVLRDSWRSERRPSLYTRNYKRLPLLYERVREGGPPRHALRSPICVLHGCRRLCRLGWIHRNMLCCLGPAGHRQKPAAARGYARQRVFAQLPRSARPTLYAAQPPAGPVGRRHIA